MDPNATLEKIRALLDELVEGQSDEVDALVEHVGALDLWLCKGGFLPKAWQDARGGAGEGEA